MKSKYLKRIEDMRLSVIRNDTDTPDKKVAVFYFDDILTLLHDFSDELIGDHPTHGSYRRYIGRLQRQLRDKLLGEEIK